MEAEREEFMQREWNIGKGKRWGGGGQLLNKRHCSL